jgi:two-component system LytT family sensor kinase
LLLPFVENSFKHGAHSSTGLAEIKIFLLLKRNILNFSVENTFEPDSTRRDPSRSGIGMSNEIRQLELVYPGRHKLKTTQEEGWYKTFLSIDLSEDNPIL